MINEKIKILSLTSNVMFKELFGKVENKKALAFLISNCFELDYNYVYDNIKYLNTKLDIDNKNDYSFDTDVMININNELLLSVEMNKGFWKGLEIRNLSYGTKLFNSQFNKGDDKSVFRYAKPMIQLNFNNDNFPKNKEIGIYTLKDEDTNEKMTDKIKIVHINLEKIRNKKYNDISELNGIEKVSKFLISDDIEEMRKLVGDDMEDILEKIISLSNDEKIIGLYNREELEEEIRDSMFDDGFEKGEKSGINQSKIEIAKKMIDEKLDFDIISRITGLSKKDIENLK